MDARKPGAEATELAETVSLAEADRRPVDPSTGALGPQAFADRYRVGARIGEGGMGEVRMCADGLIGRDVALKVVREGLEHLEARFVREARLQGQLEHPAVAPVYDLGLLPDGRAYFTMKRVRGHTFEEILAGLADGEPRFEKSYSLRKLLTAFSSLCLAVDYAHSRGVLHRDLKPSNVMLGDFGEVTILDWGIAKVMAAPDDDAALPISRETGSAPGTREGALLGTPGYMAPEQIRGAAASLDARADVYALGSILFEILTLQPLHPGASPEARLAQTLDRSEACASARAPGREVPPEIEAACVRATALAPSERTRSARELHEAVERYLDGDRDLARRRELAAEHVRSARERIEAATAAGPDAVEHRSAALRSVGRALAFDPENAEAMRTLVGLLTTPPARIPPQVELELERSRRKTARVAGRVGVLGGVSMLALVPVALWMGVRDWTTIWLSIALIVLGGAASAVLAASETAPRAILPVLVALMSSLVVVLSRIFGPFVLAPTIAVGLGVVFALHPDRPRLALPIAAGCGSLVAPFLLERAGILGLSYRFDAGGMRILPHALSLPSTPTLTFLLLSACSTIVATCLYVGRVRDSLAHAERKLQVHAWQLSQIVPPGA